MDFGDFLYDRFNNKKPHYKMSEVEKNYFKLLNVKMNDKSANRISHIQDRIIKDISNNCFNKKYQVKSIGEYKYIKKFIEDRKITNYEFLWCHGEEKMNKLDKIIEGDYDCCRDCDRPMIFINKKVSVIYCYFYKSNI